MLIQAIEVLSSLGLGSDQINHQSSSSSFRECIAACRCRKASAKLPATLLPLSRALSVLAPEPEYPLSRGAAGGAGFFPMGRLEGGAGGTGLPLVPVPAPLTPLTTGTVGTGLDEAGGGGGGREI